MAKGATKLVTFIATQYKSKPVNVSFYTERGGNVRFTATEKAPTKMRVHFRARKG
ncbi:MAG: hypothetical protein AAB794_03950 [Patescibacteria group bacterium]